MTTKPKTAAVPEAALVAPTLAVIVPVYNGIDHLRRCLAALAASQYDDFSVLVVDDGSTELVEPVVTPLGFGYTRITGPGGPARARNHGAMHVRGDYLVFIDADVCVHPDTLARFAAQFEADPRLDAIVGTYDDVPDAPHFLSQYKNLFHHYVHQRFDGVISSFWSGCGAIRRKLFVQVGGFDSQRYRRPAIEDVELGTWLSAIGYRIVLNRQIQVTHLKRWTLWTLLKTDIFHRGIPWIHLMWRAGKMANTLNATPIQRYSVVLIYVMMLAALAAMWWPMAWICVVLLAGVTTGLNLDFYRYIAARRGVWFTLRTIPLHGLYFGYCGFCVVGGTLWYWFGGDRTSTLPSS